MKIKILYITVAIFITGALAMVAPTADGIALFLSIYDVRRVLNSIDGMDPNSAVTFTPTRYSLSQIAAQDLSIKLNGEAPNSGDSNHPQELRKKTLAQAVSFPASKECTIYTSAQTFEQKSGAYAALLTALPDPSTRWNYVLLHEDAHCMWNAPLAMEALLTKNGKQSATWTTRPFYLAQHLGEAYADAYALALLHKSSPANFGIIARRLADWRLRTTAKKMIHRTHYTIVLAAEELENQSRIFQTFSDLHAFAARAAMNGMYYWLLEQGVSDQQAITETLSMQQITNTNFRADRDSKTSLAGQSTIFK